MKPVKKFFVYKGKLSLKPKTKLKGFCTEWFQIQE